MKRRTLDIITGIGGLVIATMLAVLGVVMLNNASFAKSYVKTQLSEQHVVFTAKDKLTAEEAQSPCIVANAGKALTTGKQAECYANHYIGLHVQSVAKGKTYADLGGPLFALQAQIAATKANDPALPDLQKQLATITAQRETLFHGETLRGLLLTSYGFSEMGAKAGQAGTVAFLGAGVLALLALAGLVHGVMTPATEAFAPAERKPRARRAPAVVEA